MTPSRRGEPASLCIWAVRCGGLTAAASGAGGGARFGALGGTVSPDKWIPKLAKHRWEEETTTQADQQRLIDNAPEGLDLLICHDAPADTQGLVGAMQIPEDPRARSCRASRTACNQPSTATTPEVVFHGHWHQQNRCRINHDATEVIGLAADGNPASAAILSITTLQTRYVHPLGRPTGPRTARRRGLYPDSPLHGTRTDGLVVVAVDGSRPTDRRLRCHARNRSDEQKPGLRHPGRANRQHYG